MKNCGAKENDAGPKKTLREKLYDEEREEEKELEAVTAEKLATVMDEIVDAIEGYVDGCSIQFLSADSGINAAIPEDKMPSAVEFGNITPTLRLATRCAGTQHLIHGFRCC